MSLQDASAGIPERLIAGLDYSQLGTKFEAITTKEDVHFFPASGNYFAPNGIRVLRFNLVTTSYIDPQSVRLQAVFENITQDGQDAGVEMTMTSQNPVIENGSQITTNTDDEGGQPNGAPPELQPSRTFSCSYIHSR